MQTGALKTGIISQVGSKAPPAVAKSSPKAEETSYVCTCFHMFSYVFIHYKKNEYMHCIHIYIHTHIYLYIYIRKINNTYLNRFPQFPSSQYQLWPLVPPRRSRFWISRSHVFFWCDGCHWNRVSMWIFHIP